MHSRKAGVGRLPRGRGLRPRLRRRVARLRAHDPLRGRRARRGGLRGRRPVRPHGGAPAPLRDRRRGPGAERGLPPRSAAGDLGASSQGGGQRLRLQRRPRGRGQRSAAQGGPRLQALPGRARRKVPAPDRARRDQLHQRGGRRGVHAEGPGHRLRTPRVLVRRADPGPDEEEADAGGGPHDPGHGRPAGDPGDRPRTCQRRRDGGRRVARYGTCSAKKSSRSRPVVSSHRGPEGGGRDLVQLVRRVGPLLRLLRHEVEDPPSRDRRDHSAAVRDAG